MIPIEYLNNLKPCGILPHVSRLKIRVPIMLLRDPNPSLVLRNGTKLVVKGLNNHSAEVEIITETHIGNPVYIPRIL